MKKNLFFIALLGLLLLALLPAAGAEEYFDLTDGKPVGEALDIPFEVSNELTQEYDTAEVYSYRYQILDNGFLRFAVEFTMPEGLDISAFDPPGGRHVKQISKRKTTAERSMIQFDVDPAKLQKVEIINISFYGKKNSRVFVTGHIAGLDLEPDPFVPTGNKPLQEPQELIYEAHNELTRQDALAEIHSYTFQKLENGYFRFTLEYTVPEGMQITVFNPNGRYVQMKGKNLTTSERSTIQFDLKKDVIMKAGAVVADFSAEGLGSYYATFYEKQNAFSTIYNYTEELSDGAPVGEPGEIRFWVENDLTKGKNEAAIQSYSWQEMDNGYIRFTVEYTMPEGLGIFVFNPPQGELIGMYSKGKTPGGKGKLQFDVWKDDLLSVDMLNINFFSEQGGDRCFIMFHVDENFRKE
ncbi:MAG: hypothetical protein ABS897_11180 [Eubacteriales bacterium]